MPLARWLGASYLRTAVIPLCLIELGFLASYWATGNFTYERNVETVSRLSENYLADIAAREAANIEATLSSVEGLAKVFAAETGEALKRPASASPAEQARHRMSADGVFYTSRGGADDTASFYSGVYPIGAEQKDKVWRTARLDHTMRHLKSASPLIQQVYLNTWDSYNRIYPYIDVTKQYAPGMSIPSYNFYYEADAKHNPQRKVVWTDAYIDPAGSGWMVSAIAPVYAGDKLEAVIGLDLTVDTIIDRILALNLPWQGYAMLVGRDGTILALPPTGEKDLGLTELKKHSYEQIIASDTFKPEQFNIARHPRLKGLADAVAKGRQGISRVSFNGREMLAANAKVTGPGWTLVVVAPASAIFADANMLHDQLIKVGFIMLVILLLFYVAFFAFLLWRAQVMGERVARPLLAVETVMNRIGAGEYDHAAPQCGVNEIDSLADRLVAMGQSLGAAHRKIVDQEDLMRSALDSERRVTTGQRRFINILSHEFRTPLTVIDSSGQILKRRAARLTEETVIERSDMIRRAAARIGDVMQSAMQLVRMEDGETTCKPASVAFGPLVRQAVASAQGNRAVDIAVDGDAERAAIYADRTLVHTALSAIVENACRYSPEGSPITVKATVEGDRCAVTITDHGSGIPADELPMVCERFYRGSNSTAVPGAGTGLYLATTLLDANGGLLAINSVAGTGTGTGTGTTVTASLPLARATVTELWEAA
ncbi:ATP-binding protein [Novosphingobium sp. AAP83]|uniref:ATP-binding protein n=1 Tax=Novosphingobium sp. AAP83 TaxID=1523425 RepID=UPI0009EC57A2|nr:ATP-binding protein [Novosphingobium sp. AAP83]